MIDNSKEFPKIISQQETGGSDIRGKDGDCDLFVSVKRIFDFLLTSNSDFDNRNRINATIIFALFHWRTSVCSDSTMAHARYPPARMRAD